MKYFLFCGTEILIKNYFQILIKNYFQISNPKKKKNKMKN